MSTAKWMMVALAAASLLVAGLAWRKQAANDTRASAPVSQNGLITAQTPVESGEAGTGALGGMPGGLAAGHQAGSPLDAVAPPEFKVDSQGALVLDSQTRDGIEQIMALHDRAQALARLAEATKALPASAQREAKDLYQRYVQYAQAVKQAFPAERQETMSLPQAEAQFSQLQALRETYLGDQARALWARDDAVTRKLFAYAADHLQQHPDASLIEATTVAQDRYAREAAAMQGQTPPAP